MAHAAAHVRITSFGARRLRHDGVGIVGVCDGHGQMPHASPIRFRASLLLPSSSLALFVRAPSVNPV
jgi:hypothetical protein